MHLHLDCMMTYSLALSDEQGQTNLIATQETLLHHSLWAIKEEDELWFDSGLYRKGEADIGRIIMDGKWCRSAGLPHLCLKHNSIFVIPGESINKKLVIPALSHGLLEEAHSDFCGNNLPLLDHVLYHIPASVMSTAVSAVGAFARLQI